MEGDKTMISERMKILQMVSEGKLTVDEATYLLRSIAPPSEQAEEMTQVAEAAPENFARLEAEVKSSDLQLEPVERMETPDQPVASVASPQPVAPAALVQPQGGRSEIETEPERSPWDWIKQFVFWLGPKEEYAEELEWVYDRSGVAAIAAQTTNGSIKVAGSAQDQILIHARKVIRASSLAAAEEFAQKVQIHVEQDGDRLRIYKEHPRSPLGVEVSVSYRLQTPAGIDLSLGTTNGGIQVEGTEGAVEARSTNGKIHLDGVAGHIQARTTNGSIRAKLANLEKASDFATTNGSIDVAIQRGSAPLSATTTNGAINLALPADFSGQLEAGTINGRVQTEFQLRLIKQSRNQVVGQLGDGGDTPIRLRTINGGIRLTVQA
jgi:DUF4097 and DUF4098 domain-containing protein YvlB